MKDKSQIVSCSLEEPQEKYGLAEGQNKYVHQKSQIVRCSGEDPQEKNAFAQVNERITSLEASVDALGGHFVKYQQDFASLIAEEFTRLRELINEQGLKLQKESRLRESLSRAQEELWSKMTTEWASIKCKEKITRQHTSQDTASIACTGEDLEEHGQLIRVMDGLRKDVDEARNKFGERADATEKRLAALEGAMEAQQKNTKGSLLSGELDVSERGWASRVKASETFKAGLQPATDVAKSKPCAPSPIFGTRKMASDISEMLDGLVVSVLRGTPAQGTATSIRSGSGEAECREISQSAMRKASNSVCLPVDEGKTMRTSTGVTVSSRTPPESPSPRCASIVPPLPPRASPVSRQPSPVSVPVRSTLRRMSGSVQVLSPVVVQGALSYTPVSSAPPRQIENTQKPARHPTRL